MGLRLRKSVKLGPFRATISKSGVSTSVGVKGYRVTKLANGKTMKTASIPGTGISHVTVESHKAPKKRSGKGPLIAGLAAIVLLLGLIGGCSSGKKEEEPPVDPPAATEAATSRDDVAVVPDPKPEASAPVASAPEPESNPQPASDLPEPEPAPVQQPKTESEPEAAPPPVPQPEPEPEPEKPVASEPVGPAVIGNKNSKVYHELDCGSVKKMKDSNKVPFDNADAAKAKGYDPCQNCH